MSTESHDGPQSPRSRAMSSSTSNSNHLSGSASSPAEDQTSSSANSDSTAGGESTQLDFAKREISDNLGRSSYSQLSSMTAKSPDRPKGPSSKRRKHKHKKKDGANQDVGERPEEEEEEPVNDNDDEEDAPVGETNDEERIRNPASAVLRRNDHRERIGFRQPFGDTENDSESSQGATPTDSGVNDQAHSPTDIASNLGPQINRRRKHYEPARVVLHKSDLGPDWSNGGAVTNSSSEMPSRSSSVVPLSVTNSPEMGPRPSVSHSLISLLSGSPDEYGNVPLKQLREPKQPIYVPAVLRPTDFDSYNPQVANTVFSSTSQRKPITQHWVRDANATKCRACSRQFTWYRRRHHCRKCGGVFCAADSSHKIGLDRVLNFNVLGMPCRACDACSNEFSGFCLDSPRLRDGPVATQQPIQGPEQEEVEVGGGGDWSTF